MNQKHKGKILWFNNNKGYGFINESTTNKQLYLYHNQILNKNNKVESNQEVEFEIFEETAINVNIL